MYIGIVPKAKQMCERILDENIGTNADYILEAVACSLEAIKILETENNYNYESGRADGMERMALILAEQVGKE